MRKRIIEWGLPECLMSSEYDINFKFDDDGINDTKETGYHCEDENVKFCLFDEKSKKVLFSMEFYKPSLSLPYRKRLRLELLYVHDDSLRKQGVATYYLKKLREYAIQEIFDCITINVNPDDDYFKNNSKGNALNKNELVDFYKRKLKAPGIEIMILKL